MLKLLRQRSPASARAGISISAHGTAIAAVGRDATGRVRLEHCEYLPGALTGSNLAQALREYNRTPLSVVVQPDEYQLVLLEAPDVLPAELRAAVRWRLKDMINFDIAEAVVDVFDIPDQTRRSGTRSTYAVAARSPALERYATLAREARRPLDVIDIPELCVRNLCVLSDADKTGVALLLAGERSGQLVLVRNGVLYLARHIDWSQSLDPAAPARTIDIGALALEIQRSLDYYESHYDQPAIGDLLIAPLEPQLATVADSLRAEVGLRVGLLDLNALLDCRTALSAELQGRCLLAIGAALRREEAAA